MAINGGPTCAKYRLELERRQVATELSLLKVQINPDFFFSTLNNIYALTLLDADQARAALHRLLRMMRYVPYESPVGHTRLVSQMRPLLSLTSLRDMEEKLPVGRFLRIHRSYIVGLGHIQSMERGTVRNPARERRLPRGLRPVFQPLEINFRARSPVRPIFMLR